VGGHLQCRPAGFSGGVLRPCRGEGHGGLGRGHSDALVPTTPVSSRVGLHVKVLATPGSLMSAGKLSAGGFRAPHPPHQTCASRPLARHAALGLRGAGASEAASAGSHAGASQRAGASARPSGAVNRDTRLCRVRASATRMIRRRVIVCDGGGGVHGALYPAIRRLVCGSAVETSGI
jgi:hypothetical protein